MDSDEEKEKCPVCLMDLGDTNKMITRCGHTLCGSCFVSNLNFTIRCPLCRQDMVDVSSVHAPSPISVEETPTNRDLRNLYGELILHQITAGQDQWDMQSERDMIRTQIVNLLHAFELDMRLVVSPRARPVSLSDLPYTMENSSDDSELDELMAGLEIPEN
jgi:hypothetical protein